MNIIERHWIIAYNELTDEVRFMALLSEWIPFKYNAFSDIQNDWIEIGFYETFYEALDAIIK